MILEEKLTAGPSQKLLLAAEVELGAALHLLSMFEAVEVASVDKRLHNARPVYFGLAAMASHMPLMKCT